MSKRSTPSIIYKKGERDNIDNEIEIAIAIVRKITST